MAEKKQVLWETTIYEPNGLASEAKELIEAFKEGNAEIDLQYIGNNLTAVQIVRKEPSIGVDPTDLLTSNICDAMTIANFVYAQVKDAAAVANAARELTKLGSQEVNIYLRSINGSRIFRVHGDNLELIMMGAIGGRIDIYNKYSPTPFTLKDGYIEVYSGVSV